MPKVKFVGNPCNEDGQSCEICTGDCDEDSDCEGSLRCVQRSRTDGKERVPGCRWGRGSEARSIRKTDNDFCFQPKTIPGKINYVGECSAEGYLCKECEGDCDTDDDCEGDLICLQRARFGSVPGCRGRRGSRDVRGKDVCYKPPDERPEIKFLGDPFCNFRDNPTCEICTGDCDHDDDCTGSLRCAQRRREDGVENVPGCKWGEGSDELRRENDDFCFEPTTTPGKVNYVGECGGGVGRFLCKECEGDCDTDADCEGDLVCRHRENFESVPGCSGEGGSRDVYGKDICVVNDGS